MYNRCTPFKKIKINLEKPLSIVAYYVLTKREISSFSILSIPEIRAKVNSKFINNYKIRKRIIVYRIILLLYYYQYSLPPPLFIKHGQVIKLMLTGKLLVVRNHKYSNLKITPLHRQLWKGYLGLWYIKIKIIQHCSKNWAIRLLLYKKLV